MDVHPEVGVGGPVASSVRSERGRSPQRGGTPEAHRVRSVRLNVYRLTKTKYALPPHDPFSGLGSRETPGRWNSQSSIMVYTSESRALAALETLVHVERPRNLRDPFLIVPASIPDELVESLDASGLPLAWRSSTDMRGTRTIGDAWSRHRVSVALRVPSALLPQEFNVLLAPEHPDWRHVTIGEAKAFEFDSRFVR